MNINYKNACIYQYNSRTLYCLQYIDTTIVCPIGKYTPTYTNVSLFRMIINYKNACENEKDFVSLQPNDYI